MAFVVRLNNWGMNVQRHFNFHHRAEAEQVVVLEAYWELELLYLASEDIVYFETCRASLINHFLRVELLLFALPVPDGC